jgi:glycosyltransferase involved in cell wall biosynthesis
MTNILIMTTAPFPEGIGDSVRVRHEAEALLRAGYEVHVLTRAPNGTLPGCHIDLVGLSTVPRASNLIIRRKNVRLILAHGSLYAWIALKQAPRGVPVIADFHDPVKPRFYDRKKLRISWNALTWKLMLDIEQEVIAKAEGIFCANPRVKRWLVEQGRDPSSVEVMLNGVPKSYFNIKRQRLYGHDFVAVFLGNMSRMFDFNLILSSVFYVVKHTNNVRFVFIGRGPLRPYLKKLESLCKGRVTVEKWLPTEKVPEHISACDIGLHSVTRCWHGFYACHIKTFEYMSLGLPIVATDLDYSVEVAKQANCCLTSPCEDDRTFSRNIIKLIQDRDQLRRLGRNGTEYAQNLTWEKTTQNLLNFIRSLV